MRTPSKELKRRAKQKLRGKYGLCIGAQLILYAIVSLILVMFIFAVIIAGVVGSTNLTEAQNPVTEFLIIMLVVGILSVLMIAILSLFMPGILKIYLNISVSQPASLSDLLYGFKNKPHKFLGLYFVLFLMMVVWSIPYYVVLAVTVITDFIPVMVVLAVLTYLLLLAGILVTSLYVSQALFIFTDSPDKKILQCIRESIDMMKGNKGSLFYLNISFIGMTLMGYLSMGIGYLWVVPYMYATYAEYYQELKAQKAASSIVYDADPSFESMQRQGF